MGLFDLFLILEDELDEDVPLHAQASCFVLTFCLFEVPAAETVEQFLRTQRLLLI